MDVSILVDRVMGLGSRLVPFAAGAMSVLIGLKFFGVVRSARHKVREKTGDQQLIATAVEEVSGDGPRSTYLRVAVLMELENLTDVYLKSSKLRTVLGSIYLVAGFASIAITGTNAAIPGFADTVKFSFAVNIIGEIASGFLIFGGFEAKGAAAYQLASLLRLELSQFIGHSSDYFGQSIDERWRLFTYSTEALLLKSILPSPDAKKEDSKKTIELEKAAEKT